ncbi:unnamed protein product, partial [Ectocarpus sp. 12 AP-2014]
CCCAGCLVCCLRVSCAADAVLYVFLGIPARRRGHQPIQSSVSVLHDVLQSRHVIGGRTASTRLYVSRTSMFFFVLSVQHKLCPTYGCSAGKPPNVIPRNAGTKAPLAYKFDVFNKQ